MSKQIHHHRQVAQRKRPALPAPSYPPGFFTELMRADGGWPPRFESRGQWVSRGLPAHEQAAISRAGQGFDKHALGLAGSVKHVEMWAARKAAELKEAK